MYLRAVHAENSIPYLQQFIRDNPLGILTTAIPSSKYPLIQSSHIPWILKVPSTTDSENEPHKGILQGHMARANPQSKAIIDSLSTPTETPNASSNSNSNPNVLEQEVLVLFTASAHSYVTPQFYTATKPTTHKVVPTWNYAAVQAYGRARIFFDPKNPSTDEFLSQQVAELSTMGEKHLMGYTGENGAKKAWSVDEAPTKYVELLKQAIIGIEIVVERLEGKFKMSQEMGVEDRNGVVAGFEALKTQVGDEVARTVRERSEMVESRKQQAVKS